jgi:xanthine dehydrogenase accessory factor
MSPEGALLERAAALRAARTPFVEALVVRAQRPTSARPGARALVLGDGTIEGFVGGECAEASVRLHALRALETGEPILLHIEPGDGNAPAADGAVTVANPCLSGGALEIFLEPSVPAPRLRVVGESPIAGALRELGAWAGFEVGGEEGDELAVVVASHGGDEARPLARALREDVAYVGLVASRTRGPAVLAELDVDPALLQRVHTPAGLALGSRTPREVALAVVAEIVQARRAPAGLSAARAIDPVCGMEVAITAATPRHGPQWFCGEGCRAAFEAAHA